MEGGEQRSDTIKLMFNKIPTAAVTDKCCWRQGLGNEGNQIISIPQFKKLEVVVHSGCGGKSLASGYISNIESRDFTDGLDESGEKNRGIKSDLRFLILTSGKMELAITLLWGKHQKGKFAII